MKRIPANLQSTSNRSGIGVGRTLQALALITVAVVLAGCAGFERDWKRAVTGSPRPAHPEAGAWVGTWSSSGNGHSGRLRCVVQTGGRSDGEFSYHATWAIFAGTFPTRQPLERQADGSVRSVGTWSLPAWAGGRYDYDITIRGDSFDGTWKSKRENGTFTMKRAAEGAP